MTLIIKIKPCTKKNSTYKQALWIELTYKDRRLNRNVGSSTLTCTIILLPSQVKGKATCRRGKKESRKKKKKTAKEKSSMARRKKT